MSQGGVMTLLKRGVTETEIGLAQLKAAQGAKGGAS